MSPWHQIGESCYLIVDSPVSSSDLHCDDLYTADLAHIPSLPAYQAFRRFIVNNVPSDKKYFIGLKKIKDERNFIWSTLSMNVSQWVSTSSGLNMSATSVSSNICGRPCQFDF